MVERVVGDDERRALVLQRKPAEVGDERLHVVHAVGGGSVGEPLEHALGDVDRHQFPHARREGEREEPGARTEVDRTVVRVRLRQLHDTIADGEKSGARRDLFPRLDALVPAVRVLGHKPYGSSSA